MSDAVAQPRRSRRFSFTSRRQQNAPPEDVHPGPPVTTIGFPIDDIPFPDQQQNAGSSWKRVFRRSQSVDGAHARDQSADRRASRRLVKRPPMTMNASYRRDASVSSEAAGRSSNVISSISTRIRSRRASVSTPRDEDVAALQFIGQQQQQQQQQTASVKPSQSSKHDRAKSWDVTRRPGHAHRDSQGYMVSHDGQREQQRKSDIPIKQDNPPATPTPTLRRVGSPFYHTAAEKSAIALESSTAYDPEYTKLEVRNTTAADIESWREESMIPASLRISRSKILEPGPKSPSRASLSMQENNASEHSLPKYSPPSDIVAQQEKSSDHSDGSFSLLPGQDPHSTEKLAPKHVSNTATEKISDKGIERIKSPFNEKLTHPWSPPEQTLPTSPVKAMSPRPRHKKTQSSSSSSSYASSSFSRFGEPQTPISSNASSTHLESSSSNNDRAKKEIPRNTMSPKLDKYLAKIFVVCCHCNYWHDVPSGLYAKMIIPERLLFSGLPDPSETRSSAKSSRSSSQARESSVSEQQHSKRSGRTQSFVSSHSSGSVSGSGSGSGSGFSSQSTSPSRCSPWSSPTATVQCSWCSHEMAQSCCASWTTMVHLIERHH